MPRAKNGAPPQSTTGVARSSSSHARAPCGSACDSGRPGSMSPIAMTKRTRRRGRCTREPPRHVAELGIVVLRRRHARPARAPCRRWDRSRDRSAAPPDASGRCRRARSAQRVGGRPRVRAFQIPLGIGFESRSAALAAEVVRVPAVGRGAGARDRLHRHPADGIPGRPGGGGPMRAPLVHARLRTLHVERATYSLPAVTRRLLLRWSIALLLVVGTSVSYGAAAQSSCRAEGAVLLHARLRSRSCRSRRPEPLLRRRSGNTTAASVAPAAPSPAPALVAALLAAPASPPPPRRSRRSHPISRPPAPHPLFLLTRSLRI